MVRLLLKPRLLVANLPLQSASAHEPLDVKGKPLIGGSSRCSQRLGNDRPSLAGTPASCGSGFTHLVLWSLLVLPALFLCLLSPEIRVVASDPADGLPRRLGIDSPLPEPFCKRLAPAVQVGLPWVQALTMLRLGLDAQVQWGLAW